MSASVKIMLSYDYCHFEICLGSDQDTCNVDELRKSAQRLADKAVRQYKIAKRVAEKNLHDEYRRRAIEREVEMIQARVPEDERTPEMLAKIKALQDAEHAEGVGTHYDYEDDFDESELGND